MSESENSVLGSRQEASAFLAQHNFKALVEWMTAEVLLNRPDDPVFFLKQVLEEKIAARTKGYDPELHSTYVQEVYSQAAAAAEGTGPVRPRRSIVNKIGTRANVDHEAAQRRIEILERVVDSGRLVAMETDPVRAQETIIHQCCSILDCDRATLFIVDDVNKELILKVAEGAQSIRLPLGQGIAGTVGLTGEVINIPDAYQDSRFDQHWDKETGYHTQSILCIPVKNGEGKIVGVLQAINRHDGPFTAVDEEAMSLFAGQAGITLFNAQVMELINRSSAKLRSMLDIIKALHSDLGINSLMFTITQRTHALVEADRCTLYLVDRHNNELWSMQGEVNIRIPLDRGIAGECATSNSIINIPDAYADERFNQEFDKKSGYHTKHILCMPLRTSTGEVVGVIQLINKRDGPFNGEDEELLESFLNITGPILENSQLFQRTLKEKEEEGTEFSGKKLGRTQAHSTASPAIIEEEEEEED